MVSMVKWVIVKSRWWRWRVMVVVETTAAPM